MIVKVVVVGTLATNCYIVAAEKGGHAMVVDPGEDAPAIMAALDEDDLKIDRIVVTHGHFDHTQGAWDLKKARGGEIYAHPAEDLPGTDRELADGQEFDIDGLHIKVIQTPGHSRGSCALIADGAVFSGDLLFTGGVGRTDFPGGSTEELLNSLDKLRTFPDNTVVYPGHGPATTIGEEKANNPFMLIRSGNDD
ncbi:MAG: MBL fold metallo-hydrolase [Actinomycetota bacterium]